ncbi:hypothetical protein Ddye_005215 [Dipteronia dyeriana]|uniref:HAT C-terminal dimerisation domain-containing protein n=1 Tax=Dipteronia dyeriana TaxID=168575 RepID=A0AAD9XG89_9ROSI|nr:hypothetical protein Ddye_005215 [Dipteronia dyeriana]
MASGGEGSRPRNLDKGKGPLQDLLEHEGDDVNYSDRFYHELFQAQFGSVLWKDHEKAFPILAIIAKQILGTPISTVDVEQEFSAGENILEPRWSVLCLQSLESQACVDDWTKAKFRQQELEPEIVNDFFEDNQTMGTEGNDQISLQLPTSNLQDQASN